MATKRAGSIVINLSAGTSQFVQDMERSRAKVKDFGASVRGMGGDMQHGVSGVQAVSGALRVLEGGITNNLRAAERFTANVLGLGPILQAAFPVVGAIAFAGIVTKIGEEVYKFVEQIRTAPDRMANAFRGLSEPLRLTNDQLAVANDRLANDIAKLEGKRQNSLKLALDEARVAADKLADSLDKDLENLNKVLKEQEVGKFSGFITGRASTSGDTRESEDFARNLTHIDAEGNAAVRSATTPASAQAAQDAWNKRALDALDAEIAKRKQALALAEQLQRIHTNTASQADRDAYRRANPGVGSPLVPLSATVPDQSLLVKERQESVTNLGYVRDRYSLSATNTALTQKDDSLKASAANAQQDRPFEDRMNAMTAQLDGIKARMAAIGQGEAAEVLAKAFADAGKAIEEVNKALERHHTALTAAQKAQITALQSNIAQVEAETAWKTKLDSTTDSVQNRVRSQELLTAAIGKGYEATKKASVETSVMGAVGKNYGDKDWMSAHQSDVSRLRSQYGQEYDAQHGEQAASATQALSRQIELERSLAAVQAQGAQAVAVATLASKLRKIELDGERTATGELSDATRKQMLAEIALFTAHQGNVNAAEIANLTQRTAEVKRLTAAVIEGAEAERKAALENKYEDMKRSGASPDVITAARGNDEAEHQQKIQAEALKTGLAYKNQLEAIRPQIAYLQSLAVTEQNRLMIATALKDLQNAQLRALLDQFVALRNLRDENLKLQADMSLQKGGANDGVRAFFLEMQRQAQTTASIIEETLNSALDKVSGNLAKLLTGQKTAWGKMFQSLGEETLKNTVKSGLQTTLGKLGGAFGVGGKPDGSTSSLALWVRLATAGGSAVQDDAATAPSGPGKPGFGNGGILGTGQVPTFGPNQKSAPPGGSAWKDILGSLLGIKFKGSGGGAGSGTGGTPDVSSSISFGDDGAEPDGFASGGPVKKGVPIIVGEKGHELFVPPSNGRIIDHETTKRMTAAPHRAAGGDVSPGQAYMVGERGPEAFMPAGQTAQEQASRRTPGSGGTAYYSIDARGTDPVLTEQRVKASLIAVHGSAVSTAIQGVNERTKRTPARTQG